MPVYTGRNLTISIATVSYSAQVTSCTLTPTQTTEQLITLTSQFAKQTGTVTWTLDVEGFQDWLTGATPGFSSALYTAAAAGTAVAFSFVVTAGTARTITGNIIPVFGEVGGAAVEVLSQTYSFPVDGNITVSP